MRRLIQSLLNVIRCGDIKAGSSCFGAPVSSDWAACVALYGRTGRARQLELKTDQGSNGVSGKRPSET